MSDLLPVAVRAFARPLTAERKPQSRKRQQTRRRHPEAARRPAAVLVIDCETTADAAQALQFGSYRYCRLDWTAAGPELVCVEEGLFYADDLPTSNPEGFACLEEHARSNLPAVAAGVEDANVEMPLRSRGEFCERVLWRALLAQATVVGFNLPFDLSRLAFACADARGEFAGGFSLTLWGYKRAGVPDGNPYRPRVLIRALDAVRARLGLSGTMPGTDSDTLLHRHGAFLDLRTLAYALTGDSFSLEGACDAFGVPYRKRAFEHGQITGDYIDYCREDVAATAALYQALACEYERWGLQRAPTRAYSPASLAKASLREAGISPLLDRQPDFSEEVLGYAMVGYYGGRAECRTRRVPVPVAYLDFSSAHPTACALMGPSRFLRCDHVELVDEDPANVARWLARLTLDDCFDPKLWRKLCGFALVQSQGDVLPVRACYSEGGSFGIGVNPLESDEPLWYPLADLVAAALLTRRPLRLRRVVRLRPVGRARGLRPLRIRRSRPIDPAREDLFVALVEERRRLEQAGDEESVRTAGALKDIASAASYGIFVELNRQEPAAEPTPVKVHGLDSYRTAVCAPEQPGAYFFPPLGALVPSGARLLLALLERVVSDAGGCWAFCDTDSMAIVASTHGGLVPCPGGPLRDEHGRECVRALSWAKVERIRDRFAALNPYNRELVPGSILDLEPENFDPQTGKQRELHCYAISSKRYCLFTLDDRGEPQLVKWSEHALGGFYLNPTDPEADDRDWVCELWELIVREDGLGLPAAPGPDWLDRPAMTRFTVSHPRLLRPFADLNRDKPYSEQVKPHNSLLVAHVKTGGHPADADPARFALVAPYERDPRRWQQLEWRNVYDPSAGPYTITDETVITRRGRPLAPRFVGVKTYREVLDAYRVHPEAKSLGPNRDPCKRSTKGYLKRRSVRALLITHIGKETNLLDEIQAGLIGSEEESLLEYADRRRDLWAKLVLPVLRDLPRQRTAAAAGIHRDTLADLLAGRSRPRPPTRARLTAVAASHARASLRELGLTPPRDEFACLARYISTLALPT
jgi:hypothetical protein